MTQEEAAFEADVLTLATKIKTSSLYRAKLQKEAFDRPGAMAPVAYAMFEVLCEAGAASGQDELWYGFLREALNEAIDKSREMAESQ